jgi:hypothetical protein
MRSLAQDLVAYDASGAKSTDAVASAAVHVTEKLQPQLTNLMGHGGFRALLARALVLASVEVAWLGAVQVRPNGTLDGLEALRSEYGTAEFLEGNVVLIAQLLGLLVALIGPNLSSRLVGEIWPKFRSEKWISADEEVQVEKTR